MPPGRPPNPTRKERRRDHFHCPMLPSDSHDEVSWQCARNTPRMKYPHLILRHKCRQYFHISPRSREAFSTSLEPCLNAFGHQPLKTTSTTSLGPRIQLSTNSPRTSKLCPVPQSGLWDALPMVSVAFHFSPRKFVCLCVLGHKHPFSCLFIFQRALACWLSFAFLTPAALPHSFFVVLVQFSPSRCLQYHCRLFGKKACQSAFTKSGPHSPSVIPSTLMRFFF